MADKEWSESPEDDPIELQKKQLALGKKFLDKIEAQEAAEKARAEEHAANPPRRAVVRAYNPPTFEDVSVVLKKAWDEVERIMPTAGDRVKAQAFQTLTHAAAPPPSFLE